MTQPEALRLAEYHECAADLHSIQTAAELRQLHEANQAFGKRQEWWNERMFVLEQQRDALLEALKALLPVLDKAWDFDDDVFGYLHNDAVDADARARAAIKAAEENT